MAGGPCTQNALITHLHRDDLGALTGPRPRASRKLAGLDDNTPKPEVRHHPAVRTLFQVLAAPPSIVQGEITDKGSINQRTVPTHRAALIEALHQGRTTNCGWPAPAADSACSGR